MVKSKEKLEAPTLENYNKMKRVVTILGRTLRVEIKHCPGCVNRPEEMGPCRLCRDKRKKLSFCRMLLKQIYGLKDSVDKVE